VDLNGISASIWARLLRNVPLAGVQAVASLTSLRFTGAVVASVGISVIALLEVFSLIQQGHRLGDRLAGTTVIRRGRSRLPLQPTSGAGIGAE
jgi:uncharacterized RDD family membrane protein YckC